MDVFETTNDTNTTTAFITTTTSKSVFKKITLNFLIKKKFCNFNLI